MIFIGPSIVFVIAFLFFALFTNGYPLIIPDEPRYAETAREMLETGNFFVPYLNAEPRLVKPILFYWFEAMSMNFFGVNEFAARLPSLLAGSGIVSLAYLFGSINGIGIITALVASTSFAYFLLAKLAITDMVLCFFAVASLVFFYLGFLETKTNKLNKQLLLSATMMACGFLTKGPVAIVLPMAIILLFLFLKSDPVDFFKAYFREFLLGSLIFLLINIPWYFVVHVLTNGAFTEQFFFSDNLSRMMKPHTGHKGPFWFYLPVIIMGLFPWSFFLLQSLFSGDFSSGLNLQSEKSRQEKAFSFSLIWAFVYIVFFSIASTKMPSYIAPCFFPLAFIVARWWSQRFTTTKSHKRKNLGLAWGLIVFLLVIVSSFLLYLFKFKKEFLVVDANALFLPIVLIAAIYFAATAIALTSVFADAKTSFIFFLVANIVCFTIFTNMILKPYANYRDAGTKSFVQKLSPGAKLRVFKFEPSAFSFYRKKVITHIKAKKLPEYFAGKPNHYLVYKTKNFTTFDKKAKKFGFEFEEVKSNRDLTFVKGTNFIDENITSAQ